MKQTAVRILACLVLLLAAPVMLCVFAFSLPAQYEETFLGELKYKVDALKEANGRRIIVIGGSGVAFGQRSDLLEAELPGYEVINFGMYAGLGSTVMLDLAEPLLREGDIVIFSPEQSAQTLNLYFNAEAMWQAADGSFELLWNLDRTDLGAMLGQFPYFAASKLKFVLENSAPVPEGVYSKSSFNEYGDIGYADRNRNIMTGGFDPDMMIDFDLYLPSEEFISYLNEFSAMCQQKGIRFFYRFCPMNELAVTSGGWSQIDNYYEVLADKLDCVFLNSPREAILDAGWFYDTNFHLNGAGAIVNTAVMAAELKSTLSITTPTNIEIPEMPAFADTSLIAGDNSDSCYFVFEELDGTVFAVGMTEEGKQQKQLTLPVSFEGTPVAAFTPGVFAGNTVIQEIVIQSNITRIENGSFDGCTALERLVIKNTVPESCVVGERLLLGTNCTVIVPRQSLSNYLTNYFWSIHSNRIQGREMDVSPEQDQSATQPIKPEETRGIIIYHTNGGRLKDGQGDTLVLSVDNNHLRANTAQGTRYMERDGYVLTGWNTAPDGSGTAVGLGSRIDKQDGLVLYAQWAKESPACDFDYVVDRGEVHITGYRGADAVCVIPQSIGGLSVTRICADAFRNAQIDTLVLPPTIFTVERNAFAGSAVREVYLYDSLYYIYDESFSDCKQLTTLHINAVTSPVYSGSYFDAFADRYDWFLSIQYQRKIVMFSGSSGRYGYDSTKLRAAFPEYEVANMGVYAFTNALPQLDLIRQLMQPGDILLSAPEFDSIGNQFCTTNALDAHFWAMMESNYDAASLLDLREYSNVFVSLQEYLTVRISMEPGDYSISPNWYDDDGNRYGYATYNQYGDFVLVRPNHDADAAINWGTADYTVNSFPQETIDSINAVYQRFLEQGIMVYFTYTPRNIHAITAESTIDARRELHEYLIFGLCVPVISDIEESLYPGIYFYLIDSHLSTEGAAIRTERVIADLQEQFDRE